MHETYLFLWHDPYCCNYEFYFVGYVSNADICHEFSNAASHYPRLVGSC